MDFNRIHSLRLLDSELPSRRGAVRHPLLRETGIPGRHCFGETIFQDIYRRNHWSGSVSPSGQGASPDQIREISRAYRRCFAVGVDTLLDLPCGDYTWMRLIDLPIASYIGADLLAELVQPLQTTYGDESHRFLALDLTQVRLPSADILLCRDCLVHLSLVDTGRALANVLASGIPYLLTDKSLGLWSTANLSDLPLLS